MGASEELLPGDFSGHNLIVISVDTLRADHLGLYGYERDTSPALDRIGGESIVFSRAQVQRGLTWPSLVSMFTSLYPITSNVRHNGELLAEDVPTLSKILAAEGYATAAFQSNACGAFRGTFDTLFCKQDDKRVNQLAIRWLKEAGASAQSPFFLWVHYWGPHVEYKPDPQSNIFVEADYSGPATGHRDYLDPLTLSRRTPNPAELKHVVGLYDGEVLAIDSLIDALWKTLSEEGLLERSIVVLTSDHGEELGQHSGYYFHACSTYDAVLHVPLLIRLPEGRLSPARVPQIVESIDIMPTVLELLGIDLLESFEGQSLLPLLNSEPAASEAFSHSISEYYHPESGWVRSIRTDRWRYVYNPEKIVPLCQPKGKFFRVADEELYDHSVDPKELENRVSEYPEVAAALKRELLAAIGDREPLAAPTRADPATLKQLRQLGYLVD